MNKKRVLYTFALVLILAGISAICLVFGRGHSIFFDNSSLPGTNYNAYYSIDISNKDEKIAKLNEKEKGNISITGQKFELTVKYKKDESSQTVEKVYTFDFPYNMDGIEINLPALIEGADESVYMKEYIPAAEEEIDEEVPNTDEFAMPVEG